MIRSLFTFIVIVSLSTTMAQTAHDAFMAGKIKMNSSNDPNSWVHGDNGFSTVTENDWNKWKFSYLGLEGIIETQNGGDWSDWKVNGSNIAIHSTSANLMNWTISGEDKVINLSTVNWNTWVLDGAVISGISTTDTDNFSEWEIQGGDWMVLTPHLRAAVIFTAVISTNVLQGLSD